MMLCTVVKFKDTQLIFTTSSPPSQEVAWTVILVGEPNLQTSLQA